jgi:hypothetical protein
MKTKGNNTQFSSRQENKVTPTHNYLCYLKLNSPPTPFPVKSGNMPGIVTPYSDLFNAMMNTKSVKRTSKLNQPLLHTENEVSCVPLSPRTDSLSSQHISCHSKLEICMHMDIVITLAFSCKSC